MRDRFTSLHLLSINCECPLLAQSRGYPLQSQPCTSPSSPVLKPASETWPDDSGPILHYAAATGSRRLAVDTLESPTERGLRGIAQTLGYRVDR